MWQLVGVWQVLGGLASLTFTWQEAPGHAAPWRVPCRTTCGSTTMHDDRVVTAPHRRVKPSSATAKGCVEWFWPCPRRCEAPRVDSGTAMSPATCLVTARCQGDSGWQSAAAAAATIGPPEAGRSHTTTYDVLHGPRPCSATGHTVLPVIQCYRPHSA